MKRHAAVSLLLLLLTSLLLAQPPSIEIAQPSSPAARATAFLDLLVKGDYQTAVQHFTDAMKAAAPPPKLAEIWSSIQTRMGPYKRRVATRTQKQGLYNVVLATTELERGTVDLKVLVDERGRIAGFFVVPPEPQPTAAPADAGPPP